MKRLDSRGDTIVEVLICAAVVSSVVLGAFMVSQKGSASVQDGQERSEATQILQGQVELVRKMALEASSTSDDIYSTSPKYFCIDASDPSDPKRINSDRIGGTLPFPDDDNFGTYASKCQNMNNRYNVTVSYDATTKVFSFTNRWEALNGGRDQVSLDYKVGPADIAVTPPAPNPTIDASVRGAPAVTGAACWVRKGWMDATCWNVEMFNTSVYAPGTLDRCVWNWGDGTSTTFNKDDRECKPGSLRHQYTPTNNQPNFVIYRPTVTNYGTDGSVKTSRSIYVGLPH